MGLTADRGMDPDPSPGAGSDMDVCQRKQPRLGLNPRPGRELQAAGAEGAAGTRGSERAVGRAGRGACGAGARTIGAWRCGWGTGRGAWDWGGVVRIGAGTRWGAVGAPC